MKIIIVGAGISGLSCAIFLKEEGYEPILIEKNNELRSFGAGLQLGPNAVSILNKYGFSEELAKLASFPKKIRFNNLKGNQNLLEVSLEDYENIFGAKYCYLMRSDLINMLYKKCLDLDIDIRFDHIVESVEANSKECILNTNLGSIKANKIIGADGINSKVRDSLTKNEPIFSNKVAWRGTALLSDLDPNFFEDVGVWVSNNMHAVFYPILEKNILNFVVITKENDFKGYSSSYSNSFEVDELLQKFEINQKLKNAISKSKNLFRWNIYTMPSFQWASANVGLIGDAAHPILPFMAQGSSLGIEDAYQVALNFAQKDTNLENLYRKRKLKVTRVAYYSKTSGQIYHLPSSLRKLAFTFNSYFPYFLSRRLSFAYKNILND